MAVRIRKDRKTIVCANQSIKKEGDIYIDDKMHYVLAEEMKVLAPKIIGKDKYWKFVNRKKGEKIYKKDIKMYF